MAAIIQRSFSGGEIGPQLYARSDQIKNATGAKKLRNTTVMRYGGSQSRSGTRFIAEVKDSSNPVRLIPFDGGLDPSGLPNAFVLEMGNMYMRFYKNQRPVLTADSVFVHNIQSISGETIVTTGGVGTWDPSWNGFVRQLEGVVGPTELNGLTFVTYGSTNNSFKMAYLDGTHIDSSSLASYISGGELFSLYEIATPYNVGDLPMIKFVQSNDVMTLTHPDYAIQELDHFADDMWTINPAVFNSLSAPVLSSITAPGTTTPSNAYVVTYTTGDTFEESLPSNSITITNNAAASSPNTLTFGGAPTGFLCYSIYKQLGGGGGTYGFIGTADSSTFVDTGTTPDFASPPPTLRNPFASSQNPGCCAYIQQRLTFGNFPLSSETVNMSRTGRFHNFTVSIPSQPDDAIQFTIASRKSSAVKHILDLGAMVLFTQTGEFVVNGNGQGPITPSNISLSQQSYFGSSDLRPIIIDSNALYVQARGNVVRDFGFEFETQGYRGDDLSIFSPHLFDKYTLVDWDYQQIPHSVVWAVRSDGTLLGLTYVKEQQIWAWHRHDFVNKYQNGKVENVACIPGTSLDGGNNEDILYTVVNRTINGVTKRYVEYFETRTIFDIVDYIGLDSAITYDGRAADPNLTDVPTMTLTSPSSAWVAGTQMVITSDTAIFNAALVGEGFRFSLGGIDYRFDINGFTSSTVIQVIPKRDIPVGLQGVGTQVYAIMKKTITNLSHLEGCTVSVFGDGFVIGSPNNDKYTTQFVVTNGTIVLHEPHAVVSVGLPFIADVETLKIDNPNTQPQDTYNKRINQVAAQVFETRGFWAGIIDPADDPENYFYPYDPLQVDPLLNLSEYKARNLEIYDDPVKLATENVEVNVPTQFDSDGSVFIRQVDPIPISILSVISSGDLPGGGK